MKEDYKIPIEEWHKFNDLITLEDVEFAMDLVDKYGEVRHAVNQYIRHKKNGNKYAKKFLIDVLYEYVIKNNRNKKSFTKYEWENITHISNKGPKRATKFLKKIPEIETLVDFIHD